MMVESPRINLPSAASVAPPSSPESIATSNAAAKSQNQFILCRFPNTADVAVAEVNPASRVVDGNSGEAGMALLRLEPRLRIARVPMMYAVHLGPGGRREASSLWYA